MQGVWTDGAKSLCYVECNTITLLLIGSTHAEFVGQKPVYEGKKPIDSLIEVFEIYSNAPVWDENQVLMKLDIKACYGHANTRG